MPVGLVDTVLMFGGEDCCPKQCTSIAAAWQNTYLSPLMYNLQPQQLFAPILKFVNNT